MKVFTCPSCHKAVVTSIDGMANKTLLRCVHCGYSDYAYAFGFKTPRSFDHANVKEIVETIHEIVFSGHLRDFKPEELVEDLHARHRMLDHLTVSEIINATIDNFDERDKKSLPNLLKFVEVGSNTVSIDILLEQIRKYIPPVVETTTGADNNEIESLRRRCEALSKEKRAWEEDYQKLDDKLSKLEQENKDLQDKINVLAYKLGIL